MPLIYLNKDKKDRAHVIFILLGKNPKSEADATTKERFLELIEDHNKLPKNAKNKIDIKDKEAVVAFIYKKLGGAMRTPEQEAKIQEHFKKTKKAAKDEEEESQGVDADDEDEEDEDEDEDK